MQASSLKDADLIEESWPATQGKVPNAHVVSPRARETEFQIGIGSTAPGITLVVVQLLDLCVIERQNRSLRRVLLGPVFRGIAILYLLRATLLVFEATVPTCMDSR